MANRIDRRLRLALTPQYAMVQDLVLRRGSRRSRDAAGGVRRVDRRLIARSTQSIVTTGRSSAFPQLGHWSVSRDPHRTGAHPGAVDTDECETMFQTPIPLWPKKPRREPPGGVSWKLADDSMSSPPCRSRPRVLVVDDEEAILDFVELGLRYEGFEVELAKDGPPALSAVTARRPDLILLDLNLPGLDGLDVRRRVRQVSDVPIIMLTARAMSTSGSRVWTRSTTRPSRSSSRSGLARVRRCWWRRTSAAERILRFGTLELNRGHPRGVPGRPPDPPDAARAGPAGGVHAPPAPGDDPRHPPGLRLGHRLPGRRQPDRGPHQRAWRSWATSRGG